MGRKLYVILYADAYGGHFIESIWEDKQLATDRYKYVSKSNTRYYFYEKELSQ